MIFRQQLGKAADMDIPRHHFAAQHLEHRIGAAERLEALQAEALALVLIMYCAKAQRAREAA